MFRFRVKTLSGVLLILTALFLVGCKSGSDIKIGVIIPMNDESADYGLADYGYQIRSGIQMAAEDLQAAQAAGTSKVTKRFTLISENESSDIEKVKEAFKKLHDQGVTAVIGPASSAAGIALTPLANKYKMVLISPAASSPELSTDDSDFVFRNYPSDTLEAQKIANVIFQQCKISNCLVVRSKNEFAEGISFEFLRYARASSTAIPNEVLKFDNDPSKVDFKAQADRIIELKPQAVYLAGYNNSLLPLIKEIRSRPELANLYIITHSSFLPDIAIRELGKEAVEGIIFTGYHWDPTENLPKVLEFSKKFETNYHAQPTIYAASGYDAFNILVTAIEGSKAQIADDVRAAVSTAKYPDCVLGSTEFNKRGDVTRIPVVYQMVDGKKVLLSEEEKEAIKTKVLTAI